MVKIVLLLIIDIIKMVRFIQGFLLVFLLVFTSCERSKSIVAYYPSGTIRSIWNFEQDTLNGSKTGYWENGKIAYYLSFSKGQKNGDFRYYFDNGAVSASGSYYNDKLRGYYYEYFSSDSGKIQTESYIIPIKKKEYYFYTKTYSVAGSVLSEKRFLDIGILNDAHEKTLVLEYVDKQVFDSTKLIIGRFNIDFDVVSKPDTFNISNEVLLVPLVPGYINSDGFIRGKFVGYRSLIKGDSISQRVWTNYFEVKQEDLAKVKPPISSMLRP